MQFDYNQQTRLTFVNLCGLKKEFLSNVAIFSSDRKRAFQSLQCLFYSTKYDIVLRVVTVVAEMSFYRDLTGAEIAWVPYRLRLTAKDVESSLDPESTPYKLDLGESSFCVNGRR